MPFFNIGQTAETAEPTIEVTASAEHPLPPGKHVFQLVVEDDSGNRSQPDTVEIIVRDTLAPTAVMRAPSQVEFGKPFNLDARESSDVAPGKVVRFIWTKVE